MNEPKRSIFNSLLNCSSVISTAGATAPVPALLTNISIRPNLSIVAATAAFTFSVSVMSHVYGRTSTPNSASMAAAFSSSRF